MYKTPRTHSTIWESQLHVCVVCAKADTIGAFSRVTYNQLYNIKHTTEYHTWGDAMPWSVSYCHAEYSVSCWVLSGVFYFSLSFIDVFDSDSERQKKCSYSISYFYPERINISEIFDEKKQKSVPWFKWQTVHCQREYSLTVNYNPIVILCLICFKIIWTCFYSAL